MPQGLQVFDSNGVIVFDVTDRLSRVLGIITTTASNGSISDPGLLTGTPWWMIIDDWGGASDTYSLTTSVPLITASGSTLSWAPQPGLAPGYATMPIRPVQLIYGVY